MTRGLSKQQKTILAVLKTKQHKHNPQYSWFTTQEIVSELHYDYWNWLTSWRNEPFSSGPWDSERARPHDKKRISIHRALRSLEKRGLVVSVKHGQNRMWAVPERIGENERIDDVDDVFRVLPWKLGAFVRKLPRALRTFYKTGMNLSGYPDPSKKLTEEEMMEEIKRLWTESSYNPNKSI